jgi:hypothetical protein
MLEKIPSLTTGATGGQEIWTKEAKKRQKHGLNGSGKNQLT